MSILAFAAILGAAGSISSHVVDDFVTRNGLKVLAQPWIACIMWGSFYYAWMVVIAAIVVQWKKDRLNETFAMNDSYWFAYVSTTTVGLGDFFLEPGGIIGADLAYFPLLFLFGLMMLASFFGKFSEVIVLVARRDRQSFVHTLLAKHVTWKEAFTKNIDTK